jgi:hypothetical protein
MKRNSDSALAGRLLESALGSAPFLPVASLTTSLPPYSWYLVCHRLMKPTSSLCSSLCLRAFSKSSILRKSYTISLVLPKYTYFTSQIASPHNVMKLTSCRRFLILISISSIILPVFEICDVMSCNGQSCSV